MRTMKTATAPAPVSGSKDSKFDPSTWAGQARMLARNEADATALLWSLRLIGGSVLVAGLLVLAEIDVAWQICLAWLGVLGLAIAAIWMGTYASTLRMDNAEVRAATWRMEMATGEDLDGDGQVGQPQAQAPAGHVVKVGGATPAEVVLPDLDRRADPPLIGFPISANDVLYVLTRAAREGLTVRPWEGHRLPSGVEIRRDLWGQIVDGLVTWEFATATVDTAGKRRAALRTDVHVDAMLHAVRQGAGLAPARPEG